MISSQMTFKAASNHKQECIKMLRTIPFKRVLLRPCNSFHLALLTFKVQAVRALICILYYVLFILLFTLHCALS